MYVCCPACRLDGELPDGLASGRLTCPRCQFQFENGPTAYFPNFPEQPGAGIPVGRADPSRAATQTLVSEAGVGMSVWVGTEPAPVLTPPPVRSLDPDAFATKVDAEDGPPPKPNAPPVTITVENAAAHVEWIQEEVDRFNRFVAHQLEMIQNSRLELTRADTQLQAAILTREQELNREKAVLAARVEELQRRESQLESRMREVERREQSVQTKLREVKEIEVSLREECEGSEREMQRQRQELEEAARELRSRTQSLTPNPSATPDLIESLRTILRNIESAPSRFLTAPHGNGSAPPIADAAAADRNPQRESGYET